MTWRSPAADSARAAADDLCLALRTLRESFSMQAEAVHRAGAALTAAQDLLRRAARLADDHGLYLFEDGSVSSPPPVPNQLDGVTGLSAARSVIDGVVRQESVGHSEYLTDDTTSQYGMAAVVAGLPELVPHGDGFGLGDTLWWTP